MKEQIGRIRELLTEIESDSEAAAPDSFERNFDALELPNIFCQIVDFLQPGLKPYEAAIYWYMFRHSVVSTGSQNVRVSTRGLAKKVVSSLRADSSNASISYGAVTEALAGLENKAAIRKNGDTTGDGTPYFVALPEEISWCLEAIQAATVVEVPKAIDEKKELDYYNVAENRLKIFERDSYKCYKCGKQLTRFSATLDHIQPVSKDGDNSYDNLVTCCLHDNSRRRNTPIMDALMSE